MRLKTKPILNKIKQTKKLIIIKLCVQNPNSWQSLFGCWESLGKERNIEKKKSEGDNLNSKNWLKLELLEQGQGLAKGKPKSSILCSSCKFAY